MGISTKVIPLILMDNGADPMFEATDDFLKTTLFRKKQRPAVGSMQRSVNIFFRSKLCYFFEKSGYSNRLPYDPINP